MAAKWQRVRIAIPKTFGPQQRELIAQDIIQFIKDRADGGIGVNEGKDGTFRNKRFPRYTDDYAKRKGVSRSDVDLRLSSEMLEGLDLLSHQSGSLLIGYKAGTEENAKAEGNKLGSYGRSPNPAKARPFLGISPGDLRDILGDHDDDTT